MRSIRGRMLMSLLRMIFHSPLSKSDKLSDRVYEKMKRAGVDAELFKYEGMCHCFQMFAFLPESKDAFNKAAERVRQCERE